MNSEMGFFDSVPPPPRPAQEPPPPPWVRAPEFVFGGFVPARAVLVHTSSALVVVDRITACPDGLQFDVLVARSDAPDDLADALGWSPHRHGTAEPPPEILRFGIAYPDGRRASNLLDLPRWDDEPPPHPVLAMTSGHGHRGSWEKRYWLWPLPPMGPLGFVARWPALGVEETRVDVDGALIATAASQALDLAPR